MAIFAHFGFTNRTKRSCFLAFWIVLICGSLLSATRLSAQNPEICVTGSVLGDDEPLPFASVFLLSDGMIVESGYADESGRFELHDIAPGEYEIAVSWSGILQGKIPNFIVQPFSNPIVHIDISPVLSADALYSDASFQNTAIDELIFSLAIWGACGEVNVVASLVPSPSS